MQSGLKFVFNVVLFLTWLTAVHAQCISGDCENGKGTYVYSDNTRIEGDWKDGEPNGKCTIIYKSGDIYQGEMEIGVKNGFGKYTFKSGDYYEGYYKNGERNGYGKFVKANGYSEEGVYTNNIISGNVTITYPDGDRYVGVIKDKNLNGDGIYYYSNGDKFEGSFKDGKKSGHGVLYFAKGGMLKGIWHDGDYISGSNDIKDENVITPILSNQGVYEVNVTLNDVLKLDTIFDTGASEVYFTPDIVLTLIRAKTITEEDILEGGLFIDANGNVNKSVRFNLKSVKIGNTTVENVPCAVAKSMDGSNLLGLSALKKIGRFEFDFKNSAIRF